MMIMRCARGSKYNAKATHVDGIRFPSQAEAEYYRLLKLHVMTGEVKWFLRQVPVDLPGNITYRADFLVCHKKGDIELIDVKGSDTPAFRLKRKLMQAHCPIPLRVVKAMYQRKQIVGWREI